MNEKLVFKKSFFIFLIGFIVFSIIGLMMKIVSSTNQSLAMGVQPLYMVMLPLEL